MIELQLSEAIPGEVWKEIPGLPGYFVSDYGRIYSNNIGKIRSTSFNDRGQVSLTFSVKGKKSTYTVHHLVAQAFLSDYIPGHQVIHIDGDKRNNRVKNLAMGGRYVRISERNNKNYYGV